MLSASGVFPIKSLWKVLKIFFCSKLIDISCRSEHGKITRQNEFMKKKKSYAQGLWNILSKEFVKSF